MRVLSKHKNLDVTKEQIPGKNCFKERNSPGLSFTYGGKPASAPPESTMRPELLRVQKDTCAVVGRE